MRKFLIIALMLMLGGGVVYALTWLPGDRLSTVVMTVLVVLAIYFEFVLYSHLREQESTQTIGGAADSQQISATLNSISQRLNNSATKKDVSDAYSGINTLINKLGPSLVPIIAQAAIDAMAKSDIGELRQKLKDVSSSLEAAKRDIEDKDREIQTSASRLKNAEINLVNLEAERSGKAARLSSVEQELGVIRSKLTASEDLAKTNLATAEGRQVEIERLRGEINKPFAVFFPAKLSETELNEQVSAMYQEALSGNLASISAWTTLSAFISSQADPAAKDFQLQIVRRLGVTLVSYWKHQGLSEKERHDKLVSWAKSLNEHADGRYNLLVPTLGEPVDRSRMSCATSVTAIREVLCWQVRNPAGANFSLAEVA
jgi:predicted  nucleic acid-binding Zn-ribbon protein